METLDALPKEKLLDLPEGFELWRLSPILCKEQDKNARVQSGGTFKSLVRNVKKRGALESVPFVSRQGEEFWILSGHHRVRAAIQAQVETIIVLADPAPRTRSEIVAKQLAHNSINGHDDPAVVIQLLAEVQDIEAMIEASIDRAAIEKQIKMNVTVPDVAVDYDFRTIHFAFLPTHVEQFETLAEAVGHSDMVGVASIELYDQFVKVMRKLGKTENIRSVGALLYRMMQLTEQHLEKASGAGAEI